MTITDAPPTKPAHDTVGVHKDVGFLDYVAIDALNWHTLAPWKKSALEGHHQELQPDDASDDQKFGAAFHTAVLEPEKFAAEYVTMPRFEGHPNSNAHKDAKAAWREANKHKVDLTADEHEQLTGMQARARAHPLASAILYGPGANELTVVWHDPQSRRKCKGRIDRLARVPIRLLDPTAPNADGKAIVVADIKTTKSIVARKFTNDFTDYGYHGQFAFYTDGLAAVRPMDVAFYCIAIEKKAPYDLVVYHVGDDVLEQGRLLYRRLIDRKTAADDAKRYPGISDRAVPIFLPDYAMESSGDA